MIKSIEKLRKDVGVSRMAGGEYGFEKVWMTKRAFLKDLDAIEREVEERYIKRPVDADSMTISPNDTMVDSNGKPFIVASIELLANGVWCLHEYGNLCIEFATKCRHHKPSTVEDLLRDFAYCCEEGATDKSLDEIVAEYAERLQLMEAE